MFFPIERNPLLGVERTVFPGQNAPFPFRGSLPISDFWRPPPRFRHGNRSLALVGFFFSSSGTASSLVHDDRSLFSQKH